MDHSIGAHSRTIASPRISVARRIIWDDSSAKVAKTIARSERMNILYIRKKLLPSYFTLFIMDNQFKNNKYSGFTLVEMMVVILIIAILLWLGSYWGLFTRRENARIEELAVNLVGLIDIEKTNTLLGKTEWGAIVRKRMITLAMNNTDGSITYNSYADLAEDAEDSYFSAPANIIKTSLVTKTWTLKTMQTKIFKCTNTTPTELAGETDLDIVMTGDAMAIILPADTEPHLILQIARSNLAYREIHIDRRTGLTYERAGTVTPSCT